MKYANLILGMIVTRINIYNTYLEEKDFANEIDIQILRYMKLN